jgi:hypothetical protein
LFKKTQKRFREAQFDGSEEKSLKLVLGSRPRGGFWSDDSYKRGVGGGG